MLNAGDLAVFGWSAIDDTVLIATLVDIPANTQIKFTDRGWNAAGNAFTDLTTGDGVVSWTTPSQVPAGTVLALYLGGSDAGTALENLTAALDLSWQLTVSEYTVTDPMTIAGDGLFIYQGEDTNPYFIFGLNNSSSLTVGSDGWNTSDAFLTLRDSTRPSGTGSQNAVVNGSNGIGLPGGALQKDVVVYTGPTTAATRDAWLLRLADSSNWSGSDDGSVSATILTSFGNPLAMLSAAPMLSTPSSAVAYTEDTAAVALHPTLVVTDPDSATFSGAQVSVSDFRSGDMLSWTATGSVSGSYNPITGVLGFTGSASAADYQSILRTVGFGSISQDPTLGDTDLARTVSFVLTDSSGSSSAPVSVTVNLAGVNDAPNVSGLGEDVPWTEGGPPVAAGKFASVFDPDNATLASATVAITGNFEAGADTLSFVNDGSTMGNIAASFDAATGVLSMSSAGATATLVQWTAALRAVGYSNASENPSALARTISFTVNDGALDGTTRTTTVSVIAVNDGPTGNPDFGYLNTGLVLLNGSVAVIDSSMLHEGDPDDSGDGVTYTIVGAPASGTLFLDVDSDDLVDAGEGLAPADTFTQADIDAGSLKYRHGGGAQASDSFAFVVADGGENGAPALTGQSFAIAIQSPPKLAGLGEGLPEHVEDGAATPIAPWLLVTDADSASLQSATVTITDLVSGDLLAFTSDGSTMGAIAGSYDAATGVLTLSGSATPAQYQSALRSVTYATTSDNPATGLDNEDRFLAFSVGDGSFDSNLLTVEVGVSNANDAPTVANTIANQNATEDAAFNFQFALDVFTDLDIGDVLSYSAELASGGPLPAWLSFDPLTRTFSGTPTNANVGTVSITVTADDSNGGTVSDTFDIVVANTNDAPTVANPIANQSATQGQLFDFSFRVDAFGDMDVGDTLTYSAQLAGGDPLPAWLSFDGSTRTFSGTPANDDVGTVSVTVTADDGNGGTVTDTFSIEVGDVNDAPSVANPISNQNATEDVAFNFQFAATVFTDPDVGATLTYTAELAGGGVLPAWLSFDPLTRTFSGTPTNADERRRGHGVDHGDGR